jgi:DNA-binding FadR family transcriptional regulator
MTRPPSALILWRTQILASDVAAVPASARLVALVLSTHMDRNGGSCFPSVTTIAREAGLGRSTVFRALEALERADYVERLRGGRGRPNRYRATSPTVGLLVVPERDATSAGAGHEDVQEDVHKFSPRAVARAGRRKPRARGRPDNSIDPDLARYDQ